MASVDVIIPCYNYAHLLPQSIGSVLSQGVENVRIVIIDNASTDNSVEMARQLADADKRIEIVCHAKNVGPHASFNEGIDLARADYFMILCADDLLSTGSLRKGMEALDRCPEAGFVLGTNVEPWVGETLPEPLPPPNGWKVSSGQSFIEECCRTIGQGLPAHAILVRTSLQQDVGHYRPSLPLMDDFEMVLRLARKGAVIEIDAPLGIRRIHTTNISEPLWSDRMRNLREAEAVFDSFFSREGKDAPRARHLRRAARRKLAEAAYWSAASHLFRGKTEPAFALFKYGFHLSPTSMLFPPVGHLFRTQGAFKRIATVISETVRDAISRPVRPVDPGT